MSQIASPVLPDAQGRRENIVCEHRVTRRVFSPSQDLGKDFEKAPLGFVDYVLLNTDQRPVAVVEAKRESIDPLTAKEQARSYAEGLGSSHIFLSNGLVHYYWNLRQGNPVKVSKPKKRLCGSCAISAQSRKERPCHTPNSR